MNHSRNPGEHIDVPYVLGAGMKNLNIVFLVATTLTPASAFLCSGSCYLPRVPTCIYMYIHTPPTHFQVLVSYM
jgi:hypothetical protein